MALIEDESSRGEDHARERDTHSVNESPVSRLLSVTEGERTTRSGFGTMVDPS